MPTGWSGSYRCGKWFAPVAIEIPFFKEDRSLKRKSLLVRHPNACIDCASRYTVLPGRCESPFAPSDTLPSLVGVDVLDFASGRLVHLELTPRDRTPEPFGGIGGEKRIRYIFYADVVLEGLDFGDTIGVVFLDPDELDHPIISISDAVDAGRIVEFSNKGFRMRK